MCTQHNIQENIQQRRRRTQLRVANVGGDSSIAACDDPATITTTRGLQRATHNAHAYEEEANRRRKLKQKRLVRRTEEEETFLKKGITPKSSLSLPLSSTSSRVFCKGFHQVGAVSSTTVAPPSSKQSQCDLDPLGWSDGVLMMMFACGVPPYLTLSRRFWHSCTAPV